MHTQNDLIDEENSDSDLIQSKPVLLTSNEEINDENRFEIKFSMHGDSSIDEYEDQSEEMHVPNIRIPRFKLSKTYDKRSISHNHRYI